MEQIKADGEMAAFRPLNMPRISIAHPNDNFCNIFVSVLKEVGCVKVYPKKEVLMNSQVTFHFCPFMVSDP